MLYPEERRRVLMDLVKLDDVMGGEVAQLSSNGVLEVGDHVGPNGLRIRRAGPLTCREGGAAEKACVLAPSGLRDSPPSIRSLSCSMFLAVGAGRGESGDMSDAMFP